jgi:hypothetical protein
MGNVYDNDGRALPLNGFHGKATGILRLPCQALRGPDTQAPLPERLTHVHAVFERVHPFLDGNGRTGRLLLTLRDQGRA